MGVNRPAFWEMTMRNRSCEEMAAKVVVGEVPIGMAAHILASLVILCLRAAEARGPHRLVHEYYGQVPAQLVRRGRGLPGSAPSTWLNSPASACLVSEFSEFL